MDGNEVKPRALLVFGAPCSGKTVFAEKFARKYGLAYYNLEEITKENHFTHQNALTILSLIAKTKKDLIIEGCIDSEKERVEIRNVLLKFGYAPSLIWLQTDLPTLRLRLKDRYRSVTKAKEIYNYSLKKLENPTDFEKPIILSGKHTFETQSKHVLSGLANATER
ncbi:MAG: AAA family ATPase [Candidatus Saccharibacteria bacterium]|nr:AAA family ATPase [Candidatus Saccharibacteria bacterium]